MRRICLLAFVLTGLLGSARWSFAQQPVLREFQAQQLTGEYYSEGIAVGDINGDGSLDVVHGPLWFAGPDFKASHEIYPPQPQPRERYADNFFSWVYDFDGDGRQDVLTAGFPGTPAYVYVNPGPTGQADKPVGHWAKHQVFDWVSNESPQFVDLVGDARPELVCTRDGLFGYAVINSENPLAPWEFHSISAPVAAKRFGHGLGVGDVNGDGRLDILASTGWFEQPRDLNTPRWPFHEVKFAPGGADMFAYDVDGDGDNDVITSLDAHNFGLAWHEQYRDGERGEIRFRQHLIMGDRQEQNRYGVVFSELHSVNLADINGDGLKDIVTGKTYWSHHKQSPMWDAGAVVYWFELARGEDGAVDWIPHQAAADTGIGRQLVVHDIDGDGALDFAVGGMKGAHVILQRPRKVDAAAYAAAQPRRYIPLAAGLTPVEAAARMTAPPGFRVQLAAGEPLVHQPVAMAYDARGRLWVAEAHTYPIRAEEGAGQDKILILEDTDQDGALDSRKVFAEGLNLVSGMEVGFGGVWVGAAPYLLFIPDRDGDDRPDGPPQTLLDGFGYEDTHETLNAFIWGPDGWLYGCHGVFTYSLVGRPGAADEERTPLNAGVWRYHPLRHEFEVFAHGTSNPWGVDFNDRGQAFITACVIPHLWHVIQGGRYQRQGGRHFNPHVYDDIKTIADHAHYTGNIRDHAWWGHEPQSPAGTSQAGGGHAHCGAMIYLGDNWPESCRNQIYFNNIHGNRVNCDLLERQGSGYVGHHGSDLLLANDQWFRGINLRYGPDGAVHLIDWYDKNACHRRSPEIWDRTNGRIYRIVYGDQPPVAVDLASLSISELIALHAHRNEWHVRMARRLLQERGVSEAERAELLRQMQEAADPALKLRCLWTLHAIGGLDEAARLAMLGDADEHVRAWAVQLEWEDRAAPPAFVARMVELAGADASPVVRLYLASALQRMPPASRWELAAALAGRAEDAGDHNVPLLLWYGVEPLVPLDPARALELAAASRIPLLTRHIIRRAAADDQSVGRVVELLAKSSDDAGRQRLILDELLEAFAGRVNIDAPRSWTEAYTKLEASEDPEIRDRADRVAVALGDRRIFPRMRAALADPQAPLARRRQALEILVRGRDTAAAEALLAALDEPQLRGPALRALAAFGSVDVADGILRRYSQFDDAERRDAVDTLSSRLSHAERLLTALEAEEIPRTDLHAFNVRQMLSLDSPPLTARIRKSWGEVRDTSEAKRQQIDAFKAQLTPPRVASADLSNGRRLFAKTCEACHKLFDHGGAVGPNLTGSNRANLDYILENIVDPSAVLGKDYRMTVVRTVEGRSVSGLVVKETDSAVTLRTINDTVVIPLAEIERRQLSDISMMPERLLEPLSADEIRDLVAYLGSPAQVPLRGRPAPLDAEGRVPGAFEGESLKILSKTAGDARSQKMDGFKDDRWSGADHLWWTGARPGAVLELELPVEREAEYELEAVFTRARDYGIIQLMLDGQPVGAPVDLFHSPQVVTTGVLEFPAGRLAAGAHRLGLKVVGANPQAAQAFMVGLDYVALRKKE